MTETVLPIAPDVFWGSVTLLGVSLAVLIVFCLLWVASGRGELKPGDLQKRMGLSDLPPGLFWLPVILWAAIALVVFVGLFWLVLKILLHAMPGQDQVWDFRFRLAQLAALTTVLGALVALPVTLNRLRLTREQTETSKASLFNDKITEAAADLYATRKVTVKLGPQKYIDKYEDDVIRRNAAIDRLEQLVKEQPREAERVSRLLSIYVRELSKDFPPKPVPKSDNVVEISAWARGLEPVRADMQNAAQVLGRLAGIDGVKAEDLKIDLRRANLQGFDLKALRFDKANLGEAQLQGADLGAAQLQGARLWGAQLQSANLRIAQMQGASLGNAQMQGANLGNAQMQGAALAGAQLQEAFLGEAQMQEAFLGEAQMQGANLWEAELQRANLWGAQLQGAFLVEAQMQGADLDDTQLDEDTDLSAATLRGAALRDVDSTTITQLKPFWQDVFADGSVILPDGEVRPDHWKAEKFDIVSDDFETAWRAWQRSIGFDPDKPDTLDVPDP
ncbi:pentapeptide repeat-containing protein [Primorskyibacter sp. 2E107]|uniref:pentapeptide repeat-containing protein n=1 Tax=Primorskyibacter sp. 2E107 TaxID=3403458 RepID=UPI003AF7EE2E